MANCSCWRITRFAKIMIATTATADNTTAAVQAIFRFCIAHFIFKYIYLLITIKGLLCNIY